MSSARDPAFSRRLGERGWLGRSLPRPYGGGDRSLVERFVVVEELLRWGAPVRFHWVADRPSGATITRFGTPAQKERFLPAIGRGELCRLGFHQGFGLTVTLPEIVGRQAALEMLYTSVRVDGARALQIGLADRLVPTEDVRAEAHRFAEQTRRRQTEDFAEGIEASRQRQAPTFRRR